jgi:polyvinyl alcohol dehydrogenase (cytochrome)
MRKPALLLFVQVLFAVALPAQTPSVSGEDLYSRHCAGCHEQNDPRIPHRETLRKMPAAAILRSLDMGAMYAVASGISPASRGAIANYLGLRVPEEPPPPSAFCSDRTVRLSATPNSGWNGWSPTADNKRFQSRDSAGLSLDQVRQLKLRWAFAFNGVVNAFAPVSVVDGTLFTGSAAGTVYALDARSGCIRWSYEAAAPVRTAIVAVRTTLFFGDQGGTFYSLDAANGRVRWKKKVDEHDSTRLTGSPIAYNDIILVPVTSGEEARSFDSSYQCCTMRGSLVALRARDGAVIWKTYLVDMPRRTGSNSGGTPTWGPAGAGVWSAPTLDLKRGVAYIATGNNYSSPATSLSNAIVAIQLKTGRVLWSRQTTPNDIYNGQCASGKSKECGPDFDFSSSVVLANAGGRDILIAGQKSGMVYGLDPDREGEILWQLRVGRGSTVGGVQWGMAADGANAYAAVSDMVRIPRQKKDLADLRSNDLDPKIGGGLTSIRLLDGAKVWYAPGLPCEPHRAGCSPAQSAAVTAIPGAVFSGSIDGHLRAYSTEDGRVLWDFDTAREFTAVNGVGGAHGGSIDGPGPVIVNGMLYVNSGYARTGGMPGNVLLAFAPEP